MKKFCTILFLLLGFTNAYSQYQHYDEFQFSESYTDTLSFYDTVAVCHNEFPIIYRSILNYDKLDTIFLYKSGNDTLYTNFDISSLMISYIYVIDMPEYFSKDTVYRCPESFPFQYGDSTINHEGVYNIHLTSNFFYYNSFNEFIWEYELKSIACDSVVELSVINFSIYPAFDTIYVCSNNFPVQYGDSLISKAGYYDISFKSINNCDSIISLYVKELSLDTTLISDVVCDNFLPYVYDGNSLYSSGIYYFTKNKHNGCDSLIVLDLTVNPTYIKYDTAWICEENLPYVLEGTNIYPGTYTLYKNTVATCDSIIYFTLMLYKQKTPVLSGSHDLCATETSIISISNDNGHFASYLWSTSETMPSITVSTSGTFYVYTTDINGCHDISADFAVTNKLNVTIQHGSLILCHGATSTFTATGGSNYLWNSGETTATITKGVEGMYYVTVSNNPNCVVKDSIFLKVNPLPSLTITPTTNICIFSNSGATLPEIAVLTISDTNALTSFLWSTGATGASISVSPAIRTTYSVTATNRYGCTSSSQTSVIALPEITLSGNDTICRGVQAIMTASGGNQYEWGGVPQSVSYNTAFYLPDNTTTYYVKVTTSQGCFSTKSFTIRVNSIPNTQILGERSFCRGDSLELTATGGSSYLWSTGATTNKIYVKETNSYSVTATNASGCSNAISVEATAKNIPSSQITGVLSFCSGSSTTLIASGGNTYLWNTNAISPTITVSLGGTYSVSVTNSEGCKSVSSVNVTMNSLPGVSITGTPNFCENSLTTLTALTSGSSVQWSTGATSIQIYAYSAGVYTVTATQTSTGCTASAQITVTKLDLPTVTIMGASSICEGTSTQLVASGGGTYRWNTNATTPSITISNQGTYTITVTGTNGCVNYASKIVTSNSNPTAIITSLKTNLCQGESIILNASGGNQFHWNNGAQTNSITVNSSGRYIVTVSDNNGCIDTASIKITVNLLPLINIEGLNNLCENQSTVLTSTPGYQSYIWSGGGNSNTKTITQGGTYTVTVTSVTGCVNTASITIQTLPVPAINIIGSTTICEGNSTSLVASADNSALFNWSTGSTSPYIIVNSIGTYTVTVTGLNGCSASKSTTVIVNPLPSVSITGTSTICYGKSTQLTASLGSNYTYEWTTGQTTRYITVSPQSNSDYTVFVTDGNNCTNSATMTVIVNQLPTAVIDGNSNICYSRPNILTASGGVSYLWNNGATTPAISVINAGTYSVTVTSVQGCTSTTSITTTVNPVPTVNIAGVSMICEGSSTTFTTNTNAGYLWSTGESTQSIIASTPGNYIVTVSNQYGCTATSGVTLIVQSNPAINISGISSICKGNTAELSVSGTGNFTYQWSTGETTPVISAQPNNTVVYSVTVTNQYNCFTVGNHTITVNNNPVPLISGNLVLCPGQSTTLTASGGTNYIWSNGINVSTNTVTPVGANVNFSVTVSNAYGCSASTGVTITINPAPSISLTGNPYFCDGNSTTLSVSGANTISWSTGANTQNVVISTPGTYSVTVTNNFNCQNSQSVQVTQYPLPDFSIEGSRVICSGSSSVLTVPSNFTYQWNTGETGTMIEVYPINNGSAPQQFIYSVTATNSTNCFAVDTAIINVYPSTTPSISGISTFCYGSNTELTASGGTSYLWSNGYSTASITVENQDTYSVTAYNNFGCFNSAQISTTVNPIPFPEILGNLIFCNGSSSSLTAYGGVSYLWNTGSTSNPLTVSEASTYIVTVTNSYGCTASASATTQLIESPQTSISGNLSICHGESTTLYVLPGFVSYFWNTGSASNSITITPLSTTAYSVTITNNNGCSSTFSASVNVFENPVTNLADNICEGLSYNRYGFSLPVQSVPGTFYFQRTEMSSHGCDSTVHLTLTIKSKPVLNSDISGVNSINIEGDYLYSIQNYEYVTTGFQWTIDNPYWTINQNNTNNISMHVSSRGFGTLTVIAANECGLSQPKTKTISSTIEINEVENFAGISIYPNPVTDNITIATKQTGKKNIEIYDLTGRLIERFDTELENTVFDCSNLTPNTYLININYKNKSIGKYKIIKL